ncbi:MAG: hypothetical protein OER86_06640, partial [Phycisphaerae bacterium]|nr:hypothetical protein [Phycisphaerae bacterium]
FMVYWWGNEGLLGALLQLVATVLAGLVALALWEPLVQSFLIERMPESAWGVGLVAPFALALLVIRVSFDNFIPGNVDFHNLVNRIGGGLFGFFSGVLTTGLLVIGLQMVGVGDLLGYRGYAIDADGRLQSAARLPADIRSAAKVSGLWLPVDRIADKFFGKLSDGPFGPLTSAPTLGRIHPDLAAESAGYALAAFQGSRRSVRPNNIVLVDKGSFKLAESPTRLPESVREKTGVATVVVGTQTTLQAAEGSGAADSDGNFRISRAQVTLLYATGSESAGPVEAIHPIGFIQDGEYRSLKLRGAYAYALDSPKDHYWVFHVPPGASPEALRFKLQRLELDETLSTDVAAVDNLISELGGTATDTNYAPGISLSNRLPFSANRNQVPSSIEVQGADVVGGQGTVKKPRFRPGKDLAVRSIFHAKNARILQANLGLPGDGHLLKQIMSTMTQATPTPVIHDSDGKKYQPVGFVRLSGGIYFVQLDRQRPIVGLDQLELGKVNTGSSVILLYQVPLGKIITKFETGRGKVTALSTKIE